MQKLLNILVIALLSMTISYAQSYNTATGAYALGTLTTGDANTATGWGASYWSNGVWNTTAHGYLSLFQNVGSSNSAFGSLSMYNNGSGSENCAFGFSSLYANTSGIRNTSFGNNAMYSTNNTGLNTAVGYNSLYNNVTGNFNTAIGAYSGLNCTASYNTYIGAYADANAAGYTYSTAIGYGATVTSSSMIVFGNSSIVSIGGNTGWYNYSDKRIKKDIQANVPGLKFINLLKPVTYHPGLNAVDAIVKRPEKKDKDGNVIQMSEAEKNARKVKEQILYTGFLAQEVEAAAKSIQYDFSGVDAAKNDKDLYGLRYAEFVVPLVQVTQELSIIQDSLSAVISGLKGRVEQALNELSNLKKISQTSTSRQNSEITEHGYSYLLNPPCQSYFSAL